MIPFPFFGFTVVHFINVIGGKRRRDLIKEIEDTGAALDRFIQLEMKMRGVFQDDPAGELVLKMLTVGLEGFECLFLLPLRADRTDEDLSVLENGTDIDGPYGDQGGLEFHLAPNNHAKLALDQFTDSDGA